MTKSIIPKGNKVEFEDDIVCVFDTEDNCVYYGILDYCPFKEDFDDCGKWNDKEKHYKLSNNYRLVVLNNI